MVEQAPHGAVPGRDAPAQALVALRRFITERLPLFGRYQDAPWPGEPWLYHAHLSAALNLKLLKPREVVDAAVAAYRAGAAPLAGVEGFVRQILGWREYVRGIYWTRMPGYLDLNGLDAQEDLPAWYWTGATDLACLRDAITQTLAYGYAHHIQRLMVTGLFALLYGVQPRQVHAWYLAVYVDAVEWVELPNTLGMSQYADGGLMASKPYVATGKYIQRMSPYCRGCRYDPAQRTGGWSAWREIAPPKWPRPVDTALTATGKPIDDKECGCRVRSPHTGGWKPPDPGPAGSRRSAEAPALRRSAGIRAGWVPRLPAGRVGILEHDRSGRAPTVASRKR